MKLRSYKELIVWQRGMELVEETYRLSSRFPKDERYGLTSQMQRAAVSIPSNIAEGHRRGSRKDFAHFLRIADGSAAELETQLLIAAKIYAVDISTATELLQETQKMLGAMLRKL